MPRTIDFWFDYSCPFAYLASTQIEAIAERSGAALTWQPMLLGGVFRALGTAQNLSEVLSPPKTAHNNADMLRWAEVWNVPLRKPAAHPMRTVEALRATLATGIDPAVVHGFYRAYWVEGRPPSAPDTLRDVLTRAGHNADAVLARIGDDVIRDDLRSRTDRAIALGVFGAPACIVDGERLVWGQDRLHFVEGVSLDRAYPRPEGSATMPHTLEIYWDFSSPFSYLGCTQAEALAKRTGATLVWRPMLLGAVFKAIAQQEVPLFTWADAKKKFYFDDMNRWAEYWGVPFKFPSTFPVNTVKALRLYLALPEAQRGPFRDAVMRAYWAEDRDINDDTVLREILGADADAAFEKTRTPEGKQALFEATQRAVDAGVFGAPTWVVDGKELFWGQDRIVLVERALMR